LPAVGFGVPFPGLARVELADYQAGLAQFELVETPQTGLGPIYNNVSCVACHSNPVPGGSSHTRATRFGRTTNGVFDPLIPLGGSLLHQFAVAPELQEVIPPQANTIAQRETPPLFGMGLIDAIPDSEMLQLAARPSVDGVSGRAAMVGDGVSGQTAVGKFGWKAQISSLVGFAANAEVNELGITNEFYPNENAPNGNTALLEAYEAANPVIEPNDQVNPATSTTSVQRVSQFMRFTAPPPPVPLTASAGAGQSVFQQTGCAICHVPTLVTGQSASPTLSNKQVPLYSDLLLHDMGSLGDGIAQGDASPTEMRTAPLWGLRASAPYLHDGRAPTIDAAIREHAGEAAASVQRYLKLSPVQVRQLLDFLNSI
jgi:CxxC motif-containing protein (DUF1111 family)